MYANDIIECLDETLNHFLHHFNECELEVPHYNDELGCLDIMAECSEDYLWE